MQYFNHFSCKEFFPNCNQSEILTCIKEGHFDNLLTLFMVLDNLREYLNRPIRITSTYRDIMHNMAVGGVETSQHLYGGAIDFVCDIQFETLVYYVCEFFNKSALQRYVGQLIFYHKRKFIHIGLSTPKHKFQVLHYEQREN